MSEHTKEPWRFYDDSCDGKTNRIEIVGIGKTIARIYMSDPLEDLPNAKRIVACVNACAGIPTEVLESDYAQGYEPWGYVEHLKKAVSACERQVNELAEIKKELLTALHTLYDHAETFNVSGVYFNEFMENKAALNTALEAIAKAEQQ